MYCSVKHYLERGKWKLYTSRQSWPSVRENYTRRWHWLKNNSDSCRSLFTVNYNSLQLPVKFTDDFYACFWYIQMCLDFRYWPLASCHCFVCIADTSVVDQSVNLFISNEKNNRKHKKYRVGQKTECLWELITLRRLVGERCVILGILSIKSIKLVCQCI